MTLKSSLINIEKPTPILLCKIAWRLRSAICILIFSICTLLGLNNCFAQPFISTYDADLYPTEAPFIIPVRPGQAVLEWSYTPANSTQGVPYRVLSANIIPSFDLRSNGYFLSSNGFSKVDNDTDVRYWASVIDAEHIYGRTLRINPLFLEPINDILSQKGLGTVQARSSYISLLNGTVNISPLDFRSYLQDWIIAGIVIAILIPAWYLCRRFLRG